MNETDIAKSIIDLAAPLAASLALDIWGVEVAFGKRSIVRVYVEGENGTDIDSCAELSRLLGLGLDVEDLIQGAYVLEVSSPGLERTMFTPEQLATQVGKVVEVTLHAPASTFPDRKKLLGTLNSARNGSFSLLPLDAHKRNQEGDSEDKPLEAVFSWDDVKKAKLIHFLPETPDRIKGHKPKQNKAPGKAASKTSKTAGNKQTGAENDLNFE